MIRFWHDIGIGIEKEIYSDPYFSYHYGYKKLVSHSSIKKSKITNIEKDLFKLFQDVDFKILLLNFSKKGIFINFTLKNKITEIEQERFFIKPFGTAKAFTIPFQNNYFKHREIYPTVGSNGVVFLEDFKIKDNNSYIANKIIEECDPSFYCLGFDVEHSTPNFEDLHLEIYPKKSIEKSKKVLEFLNKCGCKDSINYEKYILNYRKFSHVKFRIINGIITNIKYYRAINVNIPDFYNE